MAGPADTFPESLPAFQRMFPDDAACAAYALACAVRWGLDVAEGRSLITPEIH